MKNAVFFDIDGTLWDEKIQVPNSAREAICSLRKNGDYAFICSGRSRATIRAKELLEDIGFDGIVAGCGTHIEYEGKLIYEQNLSQEKIEYLLKSLKKYHMPVLLEGKNHLYADSKSFGEDIYISYLKGILGEDFLELDQYKNQYEINKMSADYTKGDIEGIKKELEEDYELIFHAQKVVEILPKGFSKASGIQKVCEYLNIDHENTYAFGDSANDIEMLTFVEHGIAMGNATKDAKEAADYITTSLWENGIMEGLKHFSLI